MNITKRYLSRFRKGKLYASVFATGLVQIFMVSLNTWQIAHEKLVPAVITQVAISGAWTLNVRSIAHGNWTVRGWYIAGCTLGQVLGFWFFRHVYGG